MDKFNIYLKIQQDNFEFEIEDIENIAIFTLITEGNPGSVKVMLELYRTRQSDEIAVFLNKIWRKKIIGARLWYIYKNECNNDISHILTKDLTPFTDDYFYEKFEKYI